jgi:hypothetical protein
MIYPEWIEPRKGIGRKKWEVKQVLFKGFYEELLLENQGVTLRILNGQQGKYGEGSKVALKVGKWVEYD